MVRALPRHSGHPLVSLGIFYGEFLKGDRPRRTMSDIANELDGVEELNDEDSISKAILLEWERDEVGLLPTFSEKDSWALWQGRGNWVPSYMGSLHHDCPRY